MKRDIAVNIIKAAFSITALTERKQSITVSKPKIETDISELRGSDSIHFSVWNLVFHFFEFMSEKNLSDIDAQTRIKPI